MLAQEDRAAVAAIGLAIARGVLADHRRRQRAVVGPQDADQLAARGLKPSSNEWNESEAIASESHLADIRAELDRQGRTGRAETED